MAKTNSSFNLSKPVKYQMANILDPVKRGIFKRAMIDAEHSMILAKSRKWVDPASSQNRNRPNPQKLDVEAAAEE